MKFISTVILLTIFLFIITVCNQPAIKEVTVSAIDSADDKVSKTVAVPEVKLYDEIILKNGKQKVTIDNFVRAETDHYFKVKANMGCLGSFVTTDNRHQLISNQSSG